MILSALALLAAQNNVAPQTPPRPPNFPPCRNAVATCDPWDREWPGQGRWMNIGFPVADQVWQLDRDTVTRYHPEIRVWVRINHSRDRSTRARWSRGLITLNCDYRTFRWQSLTAFDANENEMRGVWSRSHFAEPVAPDTIYETLWRFMCQRR